MQRSTAFAVVPDKNYCLLHFFLLFFVAAALQSKWIFKKCYHKNLEYLWYLCTSWSCDVKNWIFIKFWDLCVFATTFTFYRLWIIQSTKEMTFPCFLSLFGYRSEKKTRGYLSRRLEQFLKHGTRKSFHGVIVDKLDKNRDPKQLFTVALNSCSILKT